MAEKQKVSKTQAVRDYLKTHPGAKAGEVSESLTKAGLNVTIKHAYNILAELKKQRQAKKADAVKPDAPAAKTTAPAPKAAAVAPVAKPVVQPARVNKTQAVKDYLKAHHGASNSEVAAALGKMGIEISASYVANIKAKKKTRKQAVKQVVATRGIDVLELKAAMALLKLTGSLADAKTAVTAAQDIVNLVQKQA